MANNLIPYLLPLSIIIGGYLIGSIPFGLILTKLAGLGDVRQIGSGNIGATNVLRTGKKSIALLTLFLDGGKGALAYFLAATYVPDTAYYAGAAAVFGHMFPLYLKFKGGKGVATFGGFLLAAAWPVGLGWAVTWITGLIAFRMSSASGLLAAGLAPLYALSATDNRITSIIAVIAVLIFIKHKDNIARILAGTESRLGNKSKKEKP